LTDQDRLIYTVSKVDRMRRKLTLAVVFTLLFLGLTSLEFAELLNLTDKSSNDFTLTVSTQTKLHDARSQRQTPAQQVLHSRIGFFPAVSRITRSAPQSLTSSIDYLSLLCVRRT
jgi:hypothetical protein